MSKALSLKLFILLLLVLSKQPLKSFFEILKANQSDFLHPPLLRFICTQQVCAVVFSFLTC